MPSFNLGVVASSFTLPVVSGGILTSDETYYYRTFTNHSDTGAITDYFSVENKPITFDYVLVAGGGGGFYNRISSVVLGVQIPQTFTGGAGGVLTGSTTLNPSSYSIRIGSGGSNATSDWNSVKGYNSLAFNDTLTAVGGGRVGNCSLDTTGGSGGGRLNTGGCTTENGTFGQGNRGAIRDTSGECPFRIFNFGTCSGFTYCIQQNHSTGGTAAQIGVSGPGFQYACSNTLPTNNFPVRLGIESIGLTVGQGAPHGTTTTQNTGHGGAACAPAAGVLRVRYLRSAVGG